MSGLFGTLGIAARSLQAHQTAIAVTGNNLANVSNPAYARQRAVIVESLSTPTPAGLVGTGSTVATIEQIRSALVDGQIQSSTTATGYWEAQQQTLESVQADLGQQISSSTAAGDTSSQGISAGLSDLFSAFQSLSTDPTSLAQRQVLLLKASSLAGQLNRTAQQLDSLRTSLDGTLQEDAADVNEILSDIATLNGQIKNIELSTQSTANDLRDLRQEKIEKLAHLTQTNAVLQTDGTINISIGGELLVSGNSVLDTLETYDAGGGQMLVRTVTGGTPLTLGGGSMQGIIDARDGSLTTLESDLDLLASELISAVNTIHSAGFSLTGSTNEDFFTGTDALTIGINPTLMGNPALVQASGTNGATGDNQVALQLAQLAHQTIAGLNNQTFSQQYDQSVATLGAAVSSANEHASDQQVVHNMLQQQRNSISGVSIDEEMTNMMMYERAYQASARVISVVDELLQTLVNM